MSILTKKEDIIVEPTQQEIVRKEYNSIVDLNKDFFNGIRKFLELQFKLVFENEKATTQEILNEFGTSSAQLFDSAKKLQDVLEQIDPNYERINLPENIQVNEDGTVTIV